ncbi:hypothetical protein GCM10027034_22990 [Ramlibacter solisilvae]|uniref:hypothetical protein n=1 Tax=Ramlibacter tataouinensis TaxID=94132 RepID=UPI0007773F28|nr:hypothetical protein [Ramlibacter tataouinensis]
MYFCMHSARWLVFAALAAAAWPGGAQQKQASPAASQAAPSPSAGTTAGYGVRLGGFFTDDQRQAAKRYYSQRYAKGKDCPEGMARAGAGKPCKPPVEGRYWAVGQPLQKSVDTFPVPEALLSQLPPPPSGYEYLRAGDDILLVSKGMRLVVDMIEHVMG